MRRIQMRNLDLNDLNQICSITKNSRCILELFKTVLLCILSGFIEVHAIVESAIGTLDFPAGAENTGLGESGVSIANTVNSVFWNPANVAGFYEESYVNFIYSSFREEFLPSLGITDMYHEFTAFSTTLNDIFPHVDIGYAYFRNRLDQGEVVFYDDLQNIDYITHSTETVTSNCIGARGFDILSLGISFKRYDSRLAARPDNSGIGVAKGKTFDLGIRLNKKLDFLGLFSVNPSIGASALNLGNDSAKFMYDTLVANPLPRKGIAGGSCEFNLLDLFAYTIVYEMGFNLLTSPKERSKHIGHKIQITPFYAIIRGRMSNKALYERSKGWVLNINFRETVLMLFKLVKFRDKLNNTDNYSKISGWDNQLSIGGFDFKPNFFFKKSRSVICGEDQIREGQTRNDWSIGIGIIGAFPDPFKKTLKEN